MRDSSSCSSSHAEELHVDESCATGPGAPSRERGYLRYSAAPCERAAAHVRLVQRRGSWARTHARALSRRSRSLTAPRTAPGPGQHQPPRTADGVHHHCCNASELSARNCPNDDAPNCKVRGTWAIAAARAGAVSPGGGAARKAGQAHRPRRTCVSGTSACCRLHGGRHCIRHACGRDSWSCSRVHHGMPVARDYHKSKYYGIIQDYKIQSVFTNYGPTQRAP